MKSSLLLLTYSDTNSLERHLVDWIGRPKIQAEQDLATGQISLVLIVLINTVCYFIR